MPFSLFLTISPESLRLPGFSRLHSFLPPCIIILEAFYRLLLLLVSLLSAKVHSLCSPSSYFLPSTLPTLLVTVETTHVRLSTWLPSS